MVLAVVPVEILLPAKAPIKIFLVPEVKLVPAELPMAVLLSEDEVVADNEPAPIAVLLTILAKPRPTVNPFTVISVLNVAVLLNVFAPANV